MPYILLDYCKFLILAAFATFRKPEKTAPQTDTDARGSKNATQTAADTVALRQRRPQAAVLSRARRGWRESLSGMQDESRRDRPCWGVDSKISDAVHFAGTKRAVTHEWAGE